MLHADVVHFKLKLIPVNLKVLQLMHFQSIRNFRWVFFSFSHSQYFHERLLGLGLNNERIIRGKKLFFFIENNKKRKKNDEICDWRWAHIANSFIVFWNVVRDSGTRYSNSHSIHYFLLKILKNITANFAHDKVDMLMALCDELSAKQLEKRMRNGLQ